MNTCRDRSFDLDELEDVDVLDEDVEVELLELGTEVTGVTVSQNPVLNLQEASGATISRKRSMQRTSSEKEDISAKAKRSRYSQGSSTHVNVSPHWRVKEFPDEMLDVSAGKLFCDACHTVLGLKRVSLVTTCRQSGTRKVKKGGSNKNSGSSESCKAGSTTSSVTPVTLRELASPVLCLLTKL